MPKWLRLLAALEFGGGAACVVGCFIPRGVDSTTVHLSLPIFPVVAGAITAIAGFLLWIGDPLGLKLSFPVQLAQTVGFTAGVRYVFTTGFAVTWLLSSAGTGFTTAIGGQGVATLHPLDGTLSGVGLYLQFIIGLLSGLESASWTVGINVVHVVFARRLWVYMSKQRKPDPPNAVAAV